MSEPSPEYGPAFWVKACWGKYLVTAKIGVHWTLAELICDNIVVDMVILLLRRYCRPNGNITREHLYCGTVVHYIFWPFSGGAPASQPATGGGGFQSLPTTQPRLGAAPRELPWLQTFFNDG